MYIIEGKLASRFKPATKTIHLNFVGLGIHSLLVCDSKIVDTAFFGNTTYGISVLHLKQGTGLVDADKGLLRHIRRVFKIAKCPVGTPACSHHECCV